MKNGFTGVLMLLVVVGALAFGGTLYRDELFGPTGLFHFGDVVERYEREVQKLGRPGNLRLPFDTSDVSLESGDFKVFDSLGGAIGLPLMRGSQLYAPQDGLVISVEPSKSGEGSDLLILVGASVNDDEGWGFLFEGVEPVNLSPGDGFVRGELLARSARPPEGGTAMRMSYYYDGYLRSRDHECWVDLLALGDRRIWDNFVEAWNEMHGVKLEICGEVIGDE